MKRTSASILLLITVLALAAVPAEARARGGANRPALGSAVDRMWSFFSNLWSKNGCGLDPSGACAPSASDTGENGCWIDPDGVRRCEPAPAATTENGCGLDPDGACRQ